MKSQKGFTLVEMLVVLAIILILAAALFGSFSYMTKSAQRAKAQEIVDNVATSLGIMLQQKGVWPSDRNNALKLYGGQDGAGHGCVKDVALVFSAYGKMGVNASGDSLKGVDKCGIVSPWAQDVLRNSLSASEATKVPSGGTIRDHVIYFAIDTDLDGIVEAKVCGENVKVRANAIAWCAGRDGKLGTSFSKRTPENADNVYSWNRKQEVKDR